MHVGGIRQVCGPSTGWRTKGPKHAAVLYGWRQRIDSSESLPELTREQVAQALDAILRIKKFVVDHADQVFKALRMFKASGADFADCLIDRSAAAAGCDRTMTFDGSAANVADMTLIR